MTSDTLPQFGHRLALWTEAVIARGRSPFRRAEAFPPLLTSAGEETPPLVVWINRDSFMAGGIVLLPAGEGEDAVPMGMRCAEALGLKHFGTWSPREIALWECGESARRVRAFPVPDARGDGQGPLEEVLEEFKLLSVLGTLPPASLSPFYFVNLVRAAMEAAFPPLAEAVRLAQGERRLCGAQSPPRLARRKTAMTALRLLALLAGNHLPPAVQPEGLERAMSFAVDALPSPLRRLLALQEEELPLPPEAAVRFHHLFRRLGQLHIAGDRPRAARVLEILLAHEGHRLGGFPLPDAPAPSGALLLNPDRLVPEAAAELAPAPLLALTALLRELRGIPAAAVQAESGFCLTREEIPGTIVGTIADRTLPRGEERQELSTRLRASWPNRRFPLSPRTPRWGWEFLHLLGLAGEGTRFALNLPDGWLGGEFASPLLDLLREHFTLDRLERTPHALRLEGRKAADPRAETVFRGEWGERRLPWQRVREGHHALIPLALALPPSLFALLEEGRLKPLRPEDLAGKERELFLFSRSSLGRYLWGIVGGGAPLPRFEELAKEGAGRGLPVPETEVMDRLGNLPWAGGEPPSPPLLDRELALSLGTAAEPPLRPERQGAAPRRGPSLRRRGSLAEEIARTVFADGIPRFPEHYLHNYYRPSLQRFAFEGVLRAEGAFFGQITLRDAAGALLTVEGEETARALELASHGGGGAVELPQDRRLTAAILDRYCADLRQLRQALLRQCHLRVPDFRGAEALAQRIWKGRSLPPWPLFET